MSKSANTPKTTRLHPRAPTPRAVDLYGPEIVPKKPEFTVSDFIRRSGLHLLWAQPGTGKTMMLLWWMHALLADPPDPTLMGYPDLSILCGYRRVLWISTEEDTATLRYKAELVRRGMGLPVPQGRVLHLWALGPEGRITLDNLSAILETEKPRDEAEKPLDAVVLDSLTGLRPRTVNGERVHWDVDNDAANEMCLALRRLASAHNLTIFVIHHTGRDTKKGYRGPTDWWASADMMIGLEPAGRGRVRIKPEKNRDGKLLSPFYVQQTWTEDSFTLHYSGEAPDKTLSDAAKKMDTVLRERGRASQTELAGATGINRNAARAAARACCEAGLWRDTGEQKNNSPIFEHTRKPLPGNGG